MNMQNGHDGKVQTLNPNDNRIRQAKLTEVHPSKISWHPLLAEIFISPISAGTYHGERVAVSVLCGANQFESQIGPWGRNATLCKTVYADHQIMLNFDRVHEFLVVEGMCTIVMLLTHIYVVLVLLQGCAPWLAVSTVVEVVYDFSPCSNQKIALKEISKKR